MDTCLKQKWIPQAKHKILGSEMNLSRTSGAICLLPECSNFNGLSSIRNFSPRVKAQFSRIRSMNCQNYCSNMFTCINLNSEGILSGRLRFNVRKDQNLRNDQRLMLTLVFEWHLIKKIISFHFFIIKAISLLNIF